MRLAFQLISHLEPSILLKTVTKFCNTQLRYAHHRAAKKGSQVQLEKTKCLEPNPRKKTIWSIFKRAPDPKCFEKEVKKVRECETVPRPVSEEQAECDMENISKMGGKVYRTCGQAYILQKDMTELSDTTTEPEEMILENMMKDPSLKDQCDPMPPFESVEKRMLDLSERKLHPLYKRLMSIPKRPPAQSATSSQTSYKPIYGPFLPEDIPKHLKLNKEMFEKKNILHEFKKAHPPQQMIARLVEMKKNEKPTLQKKSEKKDCSKQETSSK